MIILYHTPFFCLFHLFSGWKQEDLCISYITLIICILRYFIDCLTKVGNSEWSFWNETIIAYYLHFLIRVERENSERDTAFLAFKFFLIPLSLWRLWLEGDINSTVFSFHLLAYCCTFGVLELPKLKWLEDMEEVKKKPFKVHLTTQSTVSLHVIMWEHLIKFTDV